MNDADDKCGGENCGACFMIEHGSHDIATCHVGGSLRSATCYDCAATYRRSS